MAAYFLDANVYNVNSLIQSLSDAELAEATRLPLSPLAKKLVKQHYSHRNDTVVPSEEHISDSDKALFRETHLEQLSRSIQRNSNAGRLGTAAIVLGFISLPAALLCLIQDTQPVAVRITAFTITGILIFLRFLAIPMQDRLQGLLGRRSR